MLKAAKRALNITVDLYDSVIQDLLDAAAYRLKGMGISKWDDEEDPLIRRYKLTYCRVNFGTPPDYQQLKASLDEQLAEMKMTSGYTDWAPDDAEEAEEGCTC